MLEVYNTSTGEVYAKVITNHGMTIEEALVLVGYEPYNHNPDYFSPESPDYIYSDGTQVWVEECEIRAV